MITPSEMSQCIPAAEEVLHSINYALKIQRRHLTFFPDPYFGLLFGVGFFCIIFIDSKTGVWKLVAELVLGV